MATGWYKDGWPWDSIRGWVWEGGWFLFGYHEFFDYEKGFLLELEKIWYEMVWEICVLLGDTRNFLSKKEMFRAWCEI